MRYVLEGSVRKAGSRVRITGQLVDAATGAHLWADRFDGTLEDVFDLQDQVDRKRGRGNPAKSSQRRDRAGAAEADRRTCKPMTAYCGQCHCFADAVVRTSSRWRLCYEERSRSIPTMHSHWSIWHTVNSSWSSQNWADHAPREIAELARAAMQLDGTDPEVLYRAGYLIALPGGDMAGGIALVNKSIELNPNSAIALQIVGSLYAFAGDKQNAIACLESSARLDPRYPSLDFYLGYALAHFVAGEYEATVEWTGELLRQMPNHVPSLRYRAASLGLLGRLEEGRQVVQRLLELVPNFTITRARRHIELELNNPFKTPGVADALYEGLRRCGVPE